MEQSEPWRNQQQLINMEAMTHDTTTHHACCTFSQNPAPTSLDSKATVESSYMDSTVLNVHVHVQV